LASSEGVFTHFNLEAKKSVVKGVLVFITGIPVTEMLNLPKLGISKLPSKPTKEKEKKKGNDRLSKIRFTRSTG
jgi:hypothetical protein